jgi:hypothetical protein
MWKTHGYDRLSQVEHPSISLLPSALHTDGVPIVTMDLLGCDGQRHIAGGCPLCASDSRLDWPVLLQS